MKTCEKVRHFIIKRLAATFSLLALLLCLSGGASAQEPMQRETKVMAIDSITAPWVDWETVEISGKFKMAGLPLSPSVKIFMERDSSIYISLRAPFVGEVGRAEVHDSTLLVVNKMNKTYVKEPIDVALAYYPGGVADLQDLLLGRVVVPGSGLLSTDLADRIEIYDDESGSRAIVASMEAALPGFNYGYMITPEWLNGALMVVPTEHPDVVVTLTYDWFEKGYDLGLLYQSEKRNYRATLELDEPQYGGRGFDPVKINSKYTKLSFEQFMKAVK